MDKWKKQRLEPCTECGLNGGVELTHSWRWWLFCSACQKGLGSRLLLVAVWRWNRRWRAMRKQMERKQEAATWTK